MSNRDLGILVQKMLIKNENFVLKAIISVNTQHSYICITSSDNPHNNMSMPYWVLILQYN